ncbi:hypothetical protein GCM10022631_10760 [Deinococcus rubellus]
MLLDILVNPFGADFGHDNVARVEVQQHHAFRLHDPAADEFFKAGNQKYTVLAAKDPGRRLTFFHLALRASAYPPQAPA